MLTMVHPVTDDESVRMTVKAHRRKWLWYRFRCYTNIFLKKTTTILGHDTRCLGQDLNWTCAKDKQEMSLFELTCSVPLSEYYIYKPYIEASEQRFLLGPQHSLLHSVCSDAQYTYL